MTAAPRVAELDGFSLLIDAGDSLGLGRGVAFERDVLLALQRWVQPGQTVVDIGANIGYFTAHMARLVGPQGAVHAFEPEPANHALLVQNMQRNGLAQVVVHQAALGAQAGAALLHLSEINGGMHRLYDSVLCSGPGISVPVTTLDAVLAPGVAAFIKIDIEGYEAAALRGAEGVVRGHPEMKIVSEYCPVSMLEAGASPSDFVRRLADWGLLPHQLDGRAIPLGLMLEDAERYETWGRDRFLAGCAGLANAEVEAAVARQAAQLGCQRPLIENLIFAAAL